MNIVLIGARGVGKTSLSWRLSRLTRRSVLSTDLLISYDHQGHSIPAIVAQEGGWGFFRELEYQVIQKVGRLDQIVIDTGGGVVVDLDSAGVEIFSQRKIAALKENGFLVWLQGDPARLARQVVADLNRPALSTLLSEEEVMRRRMPFYAQAADLTVQIENRDPQELAKEILAKIPFFV
ncbi:MAG: shikimate kinase [Magnetococcus sp. DMHC-6]